MSVFVRYAWFSWVVLSALVGAGCEVSVGSGERDYEDGPARDGGEIDDDEDPDAGLFLPDASMDGEGDASVDDEPMPMEDEPAATVELARLATAVAEAQCQAQEACVGAGVLGARLRGADCVELLAAGLREGALSLVGAAIDQGFLEYDEKEMASCLENLADLRCAVNVARLGDLCAEALRGSATEGQECVSHFDCAGDRYCDYGSELTCPGLCRSRVAEGQPCISGDHEMCQVGLRCVNERCSEPAETGDSCDSAGPECGLDHECVPKAEGGRWCRPVEAVYSGVQDDACSPQTVLCDVELANGMGLVCDRDSQTCVPVSGAGEACTPGSLPEPCRADQFCEPEQRLCVDRLQAGDACVAGVEKQCNVGHACIEATCVRLGLTGEACESDEACYSGTCNLVQGTCAAVLSCL